MWYIQKPKLKNCPISKPGLRYASDLDSQSFWVWDLSLTVFVIFVIESLDLAFGESLSMIFNRKLIKNYGHFENQPESRDSFSFFDVFTLSIIFLLSSDLIPFRKELHVKDAAVGCYKIYKMKWLHLFASTTFVCLC